LPRQRFADALAAVGETPEVLAMAEEYQKAAQKVVEPSRADLINASRNYFASLKILNEENCDGITMDCLGAVFDRQIPCPPCLAWSRFLDAGGPAICEADINAVMSHTLCCKLLDKPGFMQDPVPETVHNTFIGAHCVCPTRLHGYDQPRTPFVLRSHSESDIGVSVQVLWPEGQVVTLMQFTGPDKLILGRGKVLRNFETPPAGGCRTSVELAIEAPADTRDIKGFHQLFIAGDHVRDFQAYGQMYGIATESV
jgi:L-fucose isomerase-like protein